MQGDKRMESAKCKNTLAWRGKERSQQLAKQSVNRSYQQLRETSKSGLPVIGRAVSSLLAPAHIHKPLCWWAVKKTHYTPIPTVACCFQIRQSIWFRKTPKQTICLIKSWQRIPVDKKKGKWRGKLRSLLLEAYETESLIIAAQPTWKTTQHSSKEQLNLRILKGSRSCLGSPICSSFPRMAQEMLMSCLPTSGA